MQQPDESNKIVEYSELKTGSTRSISKRYLF